MTTTATTPKTRRTKKAASTKTAPVEVVQIPPPRMKLITLQLRGSVPLVQSRFSEKARQQMQADQEAGSTTRSKRKREPKDFKALYEAAKYVSAEGWLGINAASFRNAAIAACRLVGFKMTHAKLGLFIIADGEDENDGTPLVRIIDGEPEMWIQPTRNATGVIDLRPRPLWRKWGCNLQVRYDADMFTMQDVVNLISRAGIQVGVGEGRPNSKNSAGLGFGLFDIKATP